jgi:hypothetical protein
VYKAVYDDLHCFTEEYGRVISSFSDRLQSPVVSVKLTVQGSCGESETVSYSPAKQTDSEVQRVSRVEESSPDSLCRVESTRECQMPRVLSLVESGLSVYSLQSRVVNIIY